MMIPVLGGRDSPAAPGEDRKVSLLGYGPAQKWLQSKPAVVNHALCREGYKSCS